MTCSGPLEMTLADYYKAHDRDEHFAVLPHHDITAVENVVERHDGWWLVQKKR